MRPESTGVGRPAAHTRAEITAAAIAVAEREGFAAVTMRRVAAELGTGAASLYRYVDNRTDLVDLMIDAAYAEMVLPRTDRGWRADLLDVAREGMRLGIRHGWFVDATAESPFSAGPNLARMTEHCLTLLADHPATADRKMEVLGVMGGMVRHYTDVMLRRSVPEMIAAYATYLAHVAHDGEHPQLAAVLDAADPPAAPEDPVEMLARILGMIFEGMLGPG